MLNPAKLKPDDTSAIRSYLAKIRSNLAELKEFGKDVMSKDTAVTIVSQLVGCNFPFEFLEVVKNKCGNRYPSLDQILEAETWALEAMKDKKTAQNAKTPVGIIVVITYA